MTMTPAFPLMAYIDTSATLAIAFGEPDWELTARRLTGFPVLLSSNLLEAEMRSAFEREGLAFDLSAIPAIGWVNPARPLGPEMARAIANGGYLKGADLWHIAAALYVDDTIAGKMAFITLDNKQKAVAANLGFET
jgi:predicted nucleic acid-binding protein